MRANPRRARQSWLPELDLFTGCSSRQRRDVASLCTWVDVRAGRFLCRQGEQAEECFVVVDGHADVFVDGARVAGIGPGELAGELALLGAGGLRTATVVAATDMSLLILYAPRVQTARVRLTDRAAPRASRHRRAAPRREHDPPPIS